jgi:hypothetical protein
VGGVGEIRVDREIPAPTQTRQGLAAENEVTKPSPRRRLCSPRPPDGICDRVSSDALRIPHRASMRRMGVSRGGRRRPGCITSGHGSSSWSWASNCCSQLLGSKG